MPLFSEFMKIENKFRLEATAKMKSAFAGDAGPVFGLYLALLQ
jgi:hypothetical protein